MSVENQNRKFMEMAIEEMLNSRSEHQHKYDPLVGAVLVDVNGKLLGKTHRGELRSGDHAEFTLIERFFPSTNLEGSTLYVTLEPCTVRQPPKTPCAKRIADARISQVYVGTPDPNPIIQGKGIDFLIRNNVEVDFFDLDLIDKIRHENKDFIEQYDQSSETIDVSEETFEGPSEVEKTPIPTASVNDLSHDIIQQYIDAHGIDISVPSGKLWEFLYRNGLLTKRTEDGVYIPTTAGLLLFGKNPENYLIQSKVKLEAHEGDQIITSDVGGPLVLLPEKIEQFFNKHMRFYTEIKGLKRIKIPEYPIGALREAIVNAIVHRDYNEGARILIKLYRNNLEIRSPGLPPRPITIDKIQSFNAPPYSRNPRIADTFCYMDLMEERGWGLKRMNDLLLEHGLRSPTFHYDTGYFVVKFYGRERVTIPDEIQKLVPMLNSSQKKIMKFIQEREIVTREECSKRLKISKLATLRNLNKLIELGIIKRKGKGRSTYYILLNKDEIEREG